MRVRCESDTSEEQAGATQARSLDPLALYVALLNAR